VWGGGGPGLVRGDGVGGGVMRVDDEVERVVR
jgi:hypothetical protein